MKILEIIELSIPEIKVIRTAKFRDHRGYFLEHFRRSDFMPFPSLADIECVQGNASFSKAGTIRGMHFQWSPPMGKLVRTVHGHMIDLVLDIRKDSGTFGKMLAWDTPTHDEYSDLIWIPPGFAHGNAFVRDTYIEYLCTGEYNPECEATISPLAEDISWTHCAPELAAVVRRIASNGALMTDKDRHGLTLARWRADPKSEEVLYQVR